MIKEQDDLDAEFKKLLKNLDKSISKSNNRPIMNRLYRGLRYTTNSVHKFSIKHKII